MTTTKSILVNTGQSNIVASQRKSSWSLATSEMNNNSSFIFPPTMPTGKRRKLHFLHCSGRITFSHCQHIPRLLLVRSFNQPQFCSNASWNPNAITFADNTIVGPYPRALFITSKNTMVVPRNDNGQILIWNDDTTHPTRTIVANLSFPATLFVTVDDQIFVDNGGIKGQVNRWTLNGTRFASLLFLYSQCESLFVDVNNNLYCCAAEQHQVVYQSLSDPSTEMTILAGRGCAGSTAQMLNYPTGIFVTITLDLYVADHNNDRVQLFRWGQRNGETVAGSGSNGPITLNRPTVVFVDGDDYLFIVDTGHARIVRSGPDGFRCVLGCSGSGGPGSHQLN